jgi:transposase
VSHADALLTPRARLRLARLVVESGWTYSAAAKMFMVWARTAAKWADRYRTEGLAGMVDRSSRPHRSPDKTPEQLTRQIVRLRWRKRLGPVQIAGQLGVPASTVHAVLVGCRINRLSHIDRVTGEPIRRYEHGATAAPRWPTGPANGSRCRSSHPASPDATATSNRSTAGSATNASTSTSAGHSPKPGS